VSQASQKVTVTLERDGGVWIKGGRRPLHIEKKIIVEAGKPGFDVQYTLTNTGAEPLTARFGVETNWGIAGGDEAEGAYILFAGGDLQRLNAIEATPQAKNVAVVIEWIGRSLLKASEAATWWQFPLETISLSEAGFERTYQGTTLMAHWPLTLEPNGVWKVKLQFELVTSAK
jgi:alpha-amylase